MKSSTYSLVPALLLPLVVGALSAFLTGDQMIAYRTMPKPPLAPPSIVFPIAWTILYILMGFASYLVWNATNAGPWKIFALSWYLIQLIMNFFWSIIFFRLEMYLPAFLWLLTMYIAIILCTTYFFRIRQEAGWLMIPYNLWMAFAAYLNLAIVCMQS